MQYVLTALAALTLAGGVWVGAYFELPRIARVGGYLLAIHGTAKIYSPVNGYLSKLAVVNAQTVPKGALLAEVTTERFANNANIDAAQAQLTWKKLALSKAELHTVEVTAASNQRTLTMQLASIDAELARLAQELKLSHMRLNDATAQLERQQRLLAQGFVSTEALEAKRNEWLQQQIALSGLERSESSLRRESTKLNEELSLVETRAQTQRNLLGKEWALMQQEVNEQATKRTQLVAPIAGVVTQLAVAAGQLVKPDAPLFVLAPNDSPLEVVVWVPSKSIGFIRLGQKVSVRYAAYPHEHYGRHIGIIKEISKIALPPQELPQHMPSTEPIFTVRVALPTAALVFQGKSLALSAGMLLEADIELDRLKVYQWLLEPLFRLGSRI